MKNINLLLIALILLVSCGGLKEVGKVMRNEKIKTTDEFLVKKKEPLVLPPDFNKIPEPGSLSKNKEDESEDRIKKILKAPSTNDTKENNSSSVEDTIIDRIRKWKIINLYSRTTYIQNI